jgi:hypothetical protein
MRLLYRSILCLHPPAFRRRFGGEMLWIFDQALASAGVPALLWDGLVSHGRQWLLRSGSWLVGAAMAGAVIQVILVGIGMLAAGHSRAAYPDSVPIGMLSLLRLTAWLVAGILLTVLLAVLWFRKVSLCSNSAKSRNATRALSPLKT